jgi:hypothetical protein
MPYFSDLTPYSFLLAKDEVSASLLSVGWLSRFHSFPKKPVDARLLEKLLKLCRKPVRLTRGFHRCDFCSGSANSMISMTVDGDKVRLGNGEIRVPGTNGVAYAAPTLICHYIDQHEYGPPQEFLDAVALL